MTETGTDFPVLRRHGVGGILVQFGTSFSEAANRAALAFRAALDRACPAGVEEAATSLTSVFIRFDARAGTRHDLEARVKVLLSERDWFQEELPTGRRLLRVPTVFGGAQAPQLRQAAEAAGLSEAAALQQLRTTCVRVLAIGFAPGQPYLGMLPDAWDIPRQTNLSNVPEGALVLAVRQLVLFSNASPTGWLHVGQTAFRPFRPEAADPFGLRPGDEMQFLPVSDAELENIRNADRTGDGGASIEMLK